MLQGREIRICPNSGCSLHRWLSLRSSRISTTRLQPPLPRKRCYARHDGRRASQLERYLRSAFSIPTATLFAGLPIRAEAGSIRHGPVTTRSWFE